MDDPKAIASRYATITRKMVHDATQVAIDAFDKINNKKPDKYKGKDAIKAIYPTRRHRHHRGGSACPDTVADGAG